MEFQILLNVYQKKSDLKFLGNNPPSTPLHPKNLPSSLQRKKTSLFCPKSWGGLGAAKRGKGRKDTHPTAPTTPLSAQIHAQKGGIWGWRSGFFFWSTEDMVLKATPGISM